MVRGGRPTQAGSNELGDRRQLEYGQRLADLHATRVAHRRPMHVGQALETAAVENPQLAEGLDADRPIGPAGGIAVFDLDRHARRRRTRAACPGQQTDAAQPLGTALAEQHARPGAHETGIRRLARAADHLRRGDHRVPDTGQMGDQRATRNVGAGRVGEQRVGARDVGQRERVGQQAAGVDGRRQGRAVAAEHPPDDLPDHDLRRVVWAPIVGQCPAGVSGEQQAGYVKARAHVADLARRFAIACQAGRGEAIERHGVAGQREQCLTQAGTAQHALQRAHMSVLAAVRGGHDGQLLVAQSKRICGTRLEQRHQREGFDRRAQVDQHVRIACAPFDASVGADLHDVATMAALDGRPAADLDQHRRSNAARVTRRAEGARCGRSSRRSVGGADLGSGHGRMVPRRGSTTVRSPACGTYNPRDEGPIKESGSGCGVTRLSTAAFDAAMVVLSGVIVVGGHLIVWAGLNGRIDGNELFSVWAIPLYAGFVLAAYLLVLWWVGRRRGTDTDHRRAYRAAIVGSAVFVIAVVAELAWRSLRQGGPEGPEGVLSPTRLALFVATILLLSGPILAIADRRAAEEGRVAARTDVLTLGVALGLLLSLLTLLTGFAHPFVIVAGSAGEDVPTELPTDLYLVPVDGSGSRRLTTTPTLWEAHPDVAPDGSRVAFARGVREDFRIFTMASAGGDELALVNGTSHEDGPVWAPTGDRISFWTAVATPPGTVTGPVEPAPAPGPSTEPRPVNLSGLGIWTIAATGGRAEALSGEGGQGGQGGQGAEAWSPTGDRMCGWTVSAGSFDVAIWDVATGSATAISTGPSEEWACTWSPDGSRVAFHSDRDGDWEIYSAAIDGSDIRQLTDDPGIDQLPRWSPDGRQIAFISSRGGELDIYVAAADGSSPRDVTNDPALDDGFYGIAWMPDGSG